MHISIRFLKVARGRLPSDILGWSSIGESSIYPFSSYTLLKRGKMQ
jgi:hypothetical protein